MKFVKEFLLLLNFLFILLFATKVFSTDIGNAEIQIKNFSNSNITVKIYPAGTIFSGDYIYSGHSYEYSLSRSRRSGVIPEWPTFNGNPYITGGSKELQHDSLLVVDFDDGDYYVTGGMGPTKCLGGISFGIWKMDLISTTDNSGIIESYYLDYRDYNIDSYPSPYSFDIYIFLYGVTPDSVKVEYSGAQQIVPMSDSRFHNRTIKIWDQVGRLDLNGNQIPPRIPNKGLFTTSNENDQYLIFPINAKKFGAYGHENPGDLGMNVVINHDISTWDTLFVFPISIIIKSGIYLAISSNKILTFKEVDSTCSNCYTKMNVEDDGRLVLYSGSKIIIENKNQLTLDINSRLYLGNNAEIRVKSGGSFCNYSSLVRGNGSIVIEGGYHPKCLSTIDNVISDSTKFILDSNAIYEIPDSSTLKFVGNETKLIMNPGSLIKFGNGSKLLFDSSASLIANGATFTSLDSTKLWEGIVLQNSGYDTIKNCTFKNAKTTISIINTGDFSYLRRIFRNNIFYVPSGGDYKAIYGENNYRILISGNTFNMPVVSSGTYIYTGIYLKNSSTSGYANEDDEPIPQYFMNIINNTFNNGSTSIILANYISTLSTYYVGNNTFNDAADINLLGMKINGRIKNNDFTSDDVPMGIHLINSSPDMFGNSITARDISLHLAGHCYPNLAPYISDDYLVWTGGKNILSTVELDNVQLSSTGNVFTDLGKNFFNTDNSNADHIYGFVDSSFVKYDTRNNCWLPYETAKINLKKYFDSVAIATLNSSEECEETITPVSSQINYLGSEMYDTVLISSYDSEVQTPAEDILWSQGKRYLDLLSWNDAIITYKYLIDNYPDYENLEGSAIYMYGCYQALDTTTDTSYRNTLYGNLRSYLEDKIESGIYSGSGDFEDVSHDIILACKTIIGNYNDALNGYEFISLFHPDPNIRLIASWNYEEVEALINSGYGGGERQFQVTNYDLQVEELREKRELQRMEDVINDDPVLRKMKTSFEKKSEERKVKIEKDISKESNLSEMAKENTRKSAQLDNLKEDRAKRNIFESSLLSPKEKEKRRMEDMLLTTKNIRNISDKNDNTGNVLQYKLEQNYPNPFNPTTKINFTIPKDEKVTLKIYDILGKEVKTLVNDYRNAGSYQVIFNGINLSSGIYYFKISAGKWSQVRKMMLIK